MCETSVKTRPIKLDAALCSTIPKLFIPMPIVYIHGVAVRDKNFIEQPAQLLRRYVTDEMILPLTAGDVPIIPVFWGDLAATFAWSRQSCPGGLLGMGAANEASPQERAQLMADLQTDLADLPTPASQSIGGSGLLRAGASQVADGEPSVRLKDLSPTELSDLTVKLLQTKPDTSKSKKTVASIAADDVAHDPDTFTQLAAKDTLAGELTVLQNLVENKYAELELEQVQTQGGLMLQGPGWFGDLSDRFKESLSRADQSPGFALTLLLSQLRPKLNTFVTMFLGDIFTYLSNRGTPDKPGKIIQRLLDGLAEAHEQQKARNGEPIIVMSHSMGGQIVYDALTEFLPNMPAYQHIKVDFWVATASQVGLFEEMKLFGVSDPQFGQAHGNQAPMPDPKHLGHWWNVYDTSDFLSYRAAPIFAGVDEYAFSSGMSLVQAHGGYLELPSFYRTFAEKLVAARSRNWDR
jgi:hypothetical protein